jgi:Kef-type K+ transport system membrane component KefB
MSRRDLVALSAIGLLLIGLVLAWPPPFVDDRGYCGDLLPPDDPRKSGCRFGPIPEAWLVSHWLPVLVFVAAIAVVGIGWLLVRRRGGREHRATTLILIRSSASTLAVTALILAAGVIVAAVAFGVTSGYADADPNTSACGPLPVTEPAGFDPLTGQPHGRTYVAICGGPRVVIHADLPADLVGRRAIPLPVTFLVICITALLVIAVSHSTRRRGDIRAP